MKIEGLYNAAYRAYSGISFSPEKRAESVVSDYEQQLNEDLENIPKTEQERYIDGYKSHLFAWLSAKSRCLSSMITGPARFPVERNRKALQSEMNRLEEFTEWRKKALAGIAKRIEAAKSPEQKNAERWAKIKANLEGHIETIIEIDNGINTYSSRPLFVSGITGLIKTLAKNADTEMVARCLDIIRQWNEKLEKPIITSKNSIWKMLEVCEANREKQADRANTESTEQEINGVRVVRNMQADRLQLFFDGKPEPEMISKLKHAAFKWSPSNGCWQRQLTQNAIYATKRILS